MSSNGRASADHALRALAARFEHWRRTRAVPQERIPVVVWEQAAALSTVLPPSRVAQTLRLSRGALKAHRASHLRSQSPTVPPATFGFVEVTEAPAGRDLPSGVEVEVTRPDGTRLRIHYREAAPPLAPVVRGFLGED